MKTVVRASAKTSVSAHRPTLDLSHSEKKDWELEKIQHQTHKQFSTQVIASDGSGMYWIQPPGETAPAQTYCDMTFAGGAWMLASYGYVHATSLNANNKAIPNMNNPNGYA